MLGPFVPEMWRSCYSTRCEKPDIGRVRLEVSSPETRPSLLAAPTRSQPAVAPAC